MSATRKAVFTTSAAALIATAIGAGLYTANDAPTARSAISAQAEVLTNNGDIVVREGGATTRRAIGSEGHVLTVTSGLPQWAAPAGGTVAAADITDGTAPGRALLTAATTAAQRTALRVVDPYDFAAATGVTLSSGDGTASVTGGVLRCSVPSGVSPATTARPQGVVTLSALADPWSLDVSVRIAAYTGTTGTRRAALSISSVARGLDTSLYGAQTWSLYAMQMNVSDLQVWDFTASTGPTLRGTTGVTMASDGQDWLRVRFVDGHVRVFHGRGAARPTAWTRVYEAAWAGSSGASVTALAPPATVTLGAYRSSADAESFTVDWDDLAIEYPLWSTP